MIGTYYKNIGNCPLSVFIKVLVYSNVRFLTVRGWPPKEALRDAWETIFDEYLRESDEAKYKILLKRMKDLAVMHNRARLANAILGVLRLKYNEKLTANLREMGFNFTFNPHTESYFKDLGKVQAEIKRIIVTVQEMEEALKEKNQTGNKGNRL
jgi:hypothetical protein